MSQILFDLRGLLQAPLPSKLRMGGMVRTIVEWASFMQADERVEFIAPGQEHLIRNTLADTPYEGLAATITGGNSSNTAWITGKLYRDLSHRDLLSKLRRVAALEFSSRRFPGDTFRYLQNRRAPAPSIYFLPSVRRLPAKMPAGFIPVINLYDLIPLLFKLGSSTLERECDASVRIIRDQGGHFIVNSAYTRHALASMYNVSIDNIHLVQLGVEGGDAPPKAAPSAATPYFVCISGDTQRRKNVEGTIREFGHFLDLTGSPHELLFIGPAQDAVAGLAARHAGKWAGRIKGMGHLPESGKQDLLGAASAGIYLSLHEGFGLPPLEFMKHGIPVICSNLTSIPEVVADAGLLVDPLSAGEAGDAMARITRDKTLASVLADRGLARAREFTWEKSAARLSEVLYSILQGTGPLES